MEERNHVHVIACGVLALDIKATVEQLGFPVSTSFLPGGLHNTPRELRQRLQEQIDKVSREQPAELIVLGYGVCGLGTVGIRARHIPLAIPRANDCIALFLGSDQAYRKQFAQYPGTYYISAGWVEERTQPHSSTPGKTADQKLKSGSEELAFEQLVEKHGSESAEMIRHFLTSWQRNYQRAVFIDTGASGTKRKYADIARDMAAEFGWKYEEVPGTRDLLLKLLQVQQSTDDVLVVPPHHVTTFDPHGKVLKAAPIWETRKEAAASGDGRILVLESGEDPRAEGAPTIQFGLGIDAGGTYTDVVVYDFQNDAVVQKAKALTTKWDFTVGIEKALDQLDPERLSQVDLVSLSTTLATNAIVEGQGQKVGLLIMPPYGLWNPEHITYRPLAVLDGKMEMTGGEAAPINPEQVRRVVVDMVEKEQVRAFAVTGFASCANPAHELQIKAIIREATDLPVICGHEVSETLNYRLRAQTAVLNARIIPCLEALSDQVQVSLKRRHIAAPIMVVKSDGSLMSLSTARWRPIETILSGPAASVAGASYLARSDHAMVVDIGGTTTDTALIKDGVVRTCEEGARVGGWKTHVKALDMRTLGLGGDSQIIWEHLELKIGPRRVAPVSWLAAQHAGDLSACDWLERHLDRFHTSSRDMDLVSLNGRRDDVDLSDDESRIVEILDAGPLSVQELTMRLTGDTWRRLPLERLEEINLVQRCGLTPTDLLHVTGQVDLWHADTARVFCQYFSRLMDLEPEEFANQALEQVVRHLAVELLKKQLDGQVDPEELETSPVAAALIDNFLQGGSPDFRVRIEFAHPLIGVGAPAHIFLPAAARLLGTEAIIPPHADVANAIGAITSKIFVHKQVTITPSETGGYTVQGLPDAPAFADFEVANQFAVEQLQQQVRQQALAAGTIESRIEVHVDDRIAPAASGERLFIGRVLEARLSGRPDLACLAEDSDT